MPGVRSPTAESPSTEVSDLLKDLEEKGLVDREIVNEQPVRVAYSLTDLGESLEPVIREMAAWSREHLTEAADAESSIA